MNKTQLWNYRFFISSYIEDCQTYSSIQQYKKWDLKFLHTMIKSCNLTSFGMVPEFIHY